MPQTIEAMFKFAQFKKQLFLTVVEKKRIANFIANKLSEIIFEKVGGITQACVSPEMRAHMGLRRHRKTITWYADNDGWWQPLLRDRFVQLDAPWLE